eukprot:gene34537-33614_t
MSFVVPATVVWIILRNAETAWQFGLYDVPRPARFPPPLELDWRVAGVKATTHLIIQLGSFILSLLFARALRVQLALVDTAVRVSER